MVLKYTNIQDFLNYPTMGIKIAVGPDKCFKNNDQVTGFLEAIESRVENYIGTSLIEGTYTERFVGKDYTELFYPIYTPVKQLNSYIIREVSTGEDVTSNFESTYFTTTDRIIYNMYSYSSNYEYELEYEAGVPLAEIDPIFIRAIYLQASYELQRVSAGIIEQESYMNQKNVYRQMCVSGFYEEIESILESYRTFNHWQ